MKLVSLLDFKQLTGISDEALVWLLGNHKLQCTLDKNNQLMIDIELLKNEEIVSAIASRSKELTEKDERIVAERLARIVSESLDSIVDEAISFLRAKGAAAS